MQMKLGVANTHVISDGSSSCSVQSIRVFVTLVMHASGTARDRALRGAQELDRGDMPRRFILVASLL